MFQTRITHNSEVLTRTGVPKTGQNVSNDVFITHFIVLVHIVLDTETTDADVTAGQIPADSPGAYL